MEYDHNIATDLCEDAHCAISSIKSLNNTNYLDAINKCSTALEYLKKGYESELDSLSLFVPSLRNITKDEFSALSTSNPDSDNLQNFDNILDELSEAVLYLAHQRTSYQEGWKSPYEITLVLNSGNIITLQ